jgi:hypothetical protein
MRAWHFSTCPLMRSQTGNVAGNLHKEPVHFTTVDVQHFLLSSLCTYTCTHSTASQIAEYFDCLFCANEYPTCTIGIVGERQPRTCLVSIFMAHANQVSPLHGYVCSNNITSGVHGPWHSQAWDNSFTPHNVGQKKHVHAAGSTSNHVHAPHERGINSGRPMECLHGTDTVSWCYAVNVCVFV